MVYILKQSPFLQMAHTSSILNLFNIYKFPTISYSHCTISLFLHYSSIPIKHSFLFGNLLIFLRNYAIRNKKNFVFEFRNPGFPRKSRVFIFFYKTKLLFSVHHVLYRIKYLNSFAKSKIYRSLLFFEVIRFLYSDLQELERRVCCKHTYTIDLLKHQKRDNRVKHYYVSKIFFTPLLRVILNF